MPISNKMKNGYACNFPLPPQRHLADALVAAETQAEAGGRRARRRLVGGRPGRRHSCLPFAEVSCKECTMSVSLKKTICRPLQGVPIGHSTTHRPGLG